MKRVLFILLSVCLILCAASCESKDGTTDTDTKETRPTVSADEAGIVFHGFVAETDFPTNETLTEWYVDALSIETVSGSLIYAKDDTDGLWHCWAYFVEHGERDGLTLRADTSDGLCVILDHTKDLYTSDTVLGAYYFTVQADNAPDFDLLVNGENDGMIITHADSTVARG